MSPVTMNSIPPQAASASEPSVTADTHPRQPVQGMTMAAILASLESGMPVSMQSAYAGMQLEQARLSKDQAQKKLEDVRNIQERQSQIASVIAKFRQEKATGSGHMSEEVFKEMKRLGLATEPNELQSGWRTIVPGPEMDKLIDEMQKAWDRSKPNSTERKWLDDWLPSIAKARSEGKSFSLHGQNLINLADAMDRCGTRGAFNAAVDVKGDLKLAPQSDQSWEFNLKSMTNYQEQIGTKTQSSMVLLQDFLGQYNSFLQGASTAIDRANQLLAKLASGQQ